MKDFMDQVPHGALETKDAGDDPSPSKKADTLEIKKAIDTFMSTVTASFAKTDQEIAELKKATGVDVLTREEGKRIEDALTEQKKVIEALRLDNNRPAYLGPDGTKTHLSEEQAEYEKKFGGYFRRGRETDWLGEKALSVGADPEGGYTVPVQMEAAIDQLVREVSPIRSASRVVQVSTASYKKLINMGGATSGWVGEHADRPNTTGPSLSSLEFPVMELYANPSATQSILDDSQISIDNWLADEVALEFAEQEGSAFVNGNGSMKPRGFLQYDMVEEDSWAWGKLGYRATGVAGDWADSSSDPGAEATNIIDLVYALKPAFRSNARFTMNRKTVSAMMKLRDADGRPLWHTNMREGQPDSLMGYPMLEAEDMPDIANNSLSICFGDLRRGYLIVDRVGTRVLRDPFSAKPYIQFYTTKRVGGGVSHYDAMKFLKFGTG
jgi:HK97 family phage major capsid protein